jgi:hypothetical protein
VTSGNCTVNSDLSVICSNNTSQASNVVSYGIDNTIPTPADLFMTFTSQTAGKQIWYNPNILMFHVGS